MLLKLFFVTHTNGYCILTLNNQDTVLYNLTCVTKKDAWLPECYRYLLLMGLGIISVTAFFSFQEFFAELTLTVLISYKV